MSEWYLENIPKLAFFYWNTLEFPWVRYLTLETFRKYHPDWEMVLYRGPELQTYGDQNELDVSCWDKIKDLDIRVEVIDVEKEMGVKFPCTYITCLADTMRYVVLNKTGGLYLDMDHLVFRSLEDLPFNHPNNSHVKVFLLSPPYHHILLGQPGGTYWNKVLEVQKANLPETSINALNTTACTSNVYVDTNDGVYVLPMDTTEDNFNGNGATSANAFALNWHGSGTYGKYRTILESNYMESEHPLAAAIRYCLHGDTSKIQNLNGVSWIARGE